MDNQAPNNNYNNGNYNGGNIYIGGNNNYNNGIKWILNNKNWF